MCIYIYYIDNNMYVYVYIYNMYYICSLFCKKPKEFRVMTMLLLAMQPLASSFKSLAGHSTFEGACGILQNSKMQRRAALLHHW